MCAHFLNISNCPRLVTTAELLFDSLHSTIMYYSTWNHLKELVLVPYRRTPRTNMKSTVLKTKAGTTTILISSMDDTKTKKTSSSTSATASSASSKSSRTTSSQTGKTGLGNSKEPVLRGQLHKSKTSGGTTHQTGTESSAKTTKSQIFEEVSHAKEVEDYLLNEVYFCQSKKARERRPASVAYSVGQVVQHKTAEYIGVIIGWDEVAKVGLRERGVGGGDLVRESLNDYILLR